MKLDQITEEWEKDGTINRNELDREASTIAVLQNKYMRYMIESRRHKLNLEHKYDILKLEKEKFFTGKSDASAYKPDVPGGKPKMDIKVLKSDVPMWMNADKQVFALKAEIEEENLKIECLEKIISSIHYRNNAITNIIAVMRFQSGLS